MSCHSRAALTPAVAFLGLFSWRATHRFKKSLKLEVDRLFLEHRSSVTQTGSACHQSGYGSGRERSCLSNQPQFSARVPCESCGTGSARPTLGGARPAGSTGSSAAVLEHPGHEPGREWGKKCVANTFRTNGTNFSMATHTALLSFVTHVS